MDMESIMKLDSMTEIQMGLNPSGQSKAADRAIAASSAPPAAVQPTKPPNQAPVAGVTVNFSSVAQPHDADVIDTAKVQSVKTAIANGTFKANPEAIADKLLLNAKDMLSASRRR
jgi:negative regulator of flagellin synthesis FlgM